MPIVISNEFVKLKQMKKNNRRILFLLLCAAALPAGIALLKAIKTSNVSETSPDQVDEKLKTRRYQRDLQTVKNSVEKIIPRLSTYFRNWRLVDSRINYENASAVIKAEVPVVVFTDDLEVKLNKKGGEIIVNARSASRVGNEDFGENRRHIMQLLEALDKRFLAK